MIIMMYHDEVSDMMKCIRHDEVYQRWVAMKCMSGGVDCCGPELVLRSQVYCSKYLSQYCCVQRFFFTPGRLEVF